MQVHEPLRVSWAHASGFGRSLPPEAPQVLYLPHHGIWQVSDQAKKLRVVFNSFYRVGRGPTLNECLHTEPALQLDLTNMLWRLLRITVGADIDKMYRQIMVDPNDVDLQRILWHDQDRNVNHYQLLTVTYGVNCAPYLALRVLNQLAHDEAGRFPRAARIITESSYVDDILYGANDVTTARQLRNELIGLTEAGGFRLRKWSSSHPDVIDDLPEDLHLRSKWKVFSAEQPVKTLVVVWDSASGQLRYKLPQALKPTGTTKKNALAVFARLFYPLRWVSPVIIIAKMMLQDMWRDKLEWDEDLMPALDARCRIFIGGLPGVTQIRILRWLGATSSSLLDLHGFADSSKRAYTAVVTGETTPARPLALKTRAAPVKTQTIPRLELCAAALLAEKYGQTTPPHSTMRTLSLGLCSEKVGMTGIGYRPIWLRWELPGISPLHQRRTLENCGRRLSSSTNPI